MSVLPSALSRAVATPVLHGKVAVRTSVGLAGAAALAGLLTLVPGVLHGPAVMNGSAAGTALVVLVVSVPTLLTGVTLTLADAWLGPVLWLGALGALTYNAVMFAFATPFNQAFLAYEAMLGLGIAGLVTLLRSLDRGTVTDRYTARRRARFAAPYIAVVAVANAVLWLSGVLPAVARDTAPFLRGTGLTTNPVYVQDLAFWLPAALLVAWWLWRGHRWAGLLAGGLLVFWLLEAVTVAVDQWLGSAADPSSDVATRGATYLFLGLGAVGALVLVGYLRALHDRR
jgi:hypothetical protein